MKAFCPKCGSEKGPFIFGFCKKCYLEDHKVLEVPQKLLLKKCKSCGAILVNRKWVQENSESLKEFIAKHIKVLEIKNASLSIDVEHHEKHADVLLVVSGTIDGKKVEAEYNCRICYEFKQCDSCTKRSGSYHEAVMQIRFSEKNGNKANNVLAFIENLNLEKNGSGGILKTTKVKNGFDMQIISKRTAKLIARALAKKFDASIKVSTTLAGITKDGKEKLRYTYLVKIA